MPGDQLSLLTAFDLAPPEDYFTDGDAKLPQPGHYIITWRRYDVSILFIRSYSSYKIQNKSDKRGRGKDTDRTFVIPTSFGRPHCAPSCAAARLSSPAIPARARHSQLTPSKIRMPRRVNRVRVIGKLCGCGRPQCPITLTRPWRRRESHLEPHTIGMRPFCAFTPHPRGR